MPNFAPRDLKMRQANPDRLEPHPNGRSGPAAVPQRIEPCLSCITKRSPLIGRALRSFERPVFLIRSLDV